MTEITKEILASSIDHTLLNPKADQTQIDHLCREAVEHQFCSVCVNPRWVVFAADKLHGSNVKVATVVSFPLGADSTKTKIAQTKEVIFAGADEIDVVADISAIITGDLKYLITQFQGILRVCKAMKPAVITKVIIESAALEWEHKLFACKVAEQAGFDFIKTSTGMHTCGGATVEDVKLIKDTSPACKVKASGGIKTACQAMAMLNTGADRIGTSSSVEIMNQFIAGQI
jgi:deoxyribose-phosphate aldolase